MVNGSERPVTKAGEIRKIRQAAAHLAYFSNEA